MGITINSPAPGGLALEYPDAGGNVCVYVEVDTDAIPNIASVYAIVHPFNTSAPIPAPGDAPPPAGYTQLNLVAGTDVYNNLVPVPVGHTCEQLSSGPANLKVTAIIFISGGVGFQPPAKVNAFRGVCLRTFVDVSGEACPWFAFAPTGAIGPELEPADSGCKAVRVPIPSPAGTVSISAPAATAGIWRSGPSLMLRSGPQGLGGPAVAHDPLYKDSNYRSDNITSGAFVRNRLVGVLEPATGFVSTIFDIGNGPVAPVINSSWTAICLGLWEANDWSSSSNGQAITVTFDWTPLAIHLINALVLHQYQNPCTVNPHSLRH